MIIKSTKMPLILNRRAISSVLETSTPERPALFVTRPGSEPHLLVGEFAYRNQRRKDLTDSLRKLGLAFLKSAHPSSHAVINNLLFVVDNVQGVRKVFDDGVLDGNDIFDLAKIGLNSAVRMRDLVAPSPNAMHGPDYGTCGSLVRAPDSLDSFNGVIGLIAKAKGHYKKAILPLPRPVWENPFGEAAKVCGMVNPVAGAAVTLLGLLYDETSNQPRYTTHLFGREATLRPENYCPARS